MSRREGKSSWIFITLDYDFMRIRVIAKLFQEIVVFMSSTAKGASKIA